MISTKYIWSIDGTLKNSTVLRSFRAKASPPDIVYFQSQFFFVFCFFCCFFFLSFFFTSLLRMQSKYLQISWQYTPSSGKQTWTQKTYLWTRSFVVYSLGFHLCRSRGKIMKTLRSTERSVMGGLGDVVKLYFFRLFFFWRRILSSLVWSSFLF